MKIILFPLFGLASLQVIAQESTVGLRNEFSQISKYTYGRQSGFEGLQSFSNKEVIGSQFYFPTWSAGALITSGNEVIADSYQYLYDKVRQVLFMKLKDSDVVLQANEEKIKGFQLDYNGSAHHFILASAYDSGSKAGFYEILEGNDSGYTLLKETFTKFIKFDPNNMANMAKVRNGETADEFQDEINYYISCKHGLLQAIKPKDNNIKKVLANEKSKVSNYLVTNADVERNEAFLIELTAVLNR